MATFPKHKGERTRSILREKLRGIRAGIFSKFFGRIGENISEMNAIERRFWREGWLGLRRNNRPLRDRGALRPDRLPQRKIMVNQPRFSG